MQVRVREIPGGSKVTDLGFCFLERVGGSVVLEFSWEGPSLPYVSLDAGSVTLNAPQS